MSNLNRKLIVLIFSAVLAGCASKAPPDKPHNLCHVFKEKRGWYKDAKKANQRWGTPIQIMMAIMYQESSYRHNAQPPRPWFLFIPLPRDSSAYGYSQAQDGTSSSLHLRRTGARARARAGAGTGPGPWHRQSSAHMAALAEPEQDPPPGITSPAL